MSLPRRVLVVDGTSATTPDTVSNQKHWPQPSSQKPGCGWPLISIVGIFCLSSGVLVRAAHGAWKTSEARLFALLRRMLRWGDGLRERGLLLASESLASQAEAARVQVRDGKSQIIDGPFSEAKEMVGGFFLLSCETRQEALAIAATCPAAEWATVEVRSLAPCFETGR